MVQVELYCRVQQLLAKNQEELQQQYANFVKELSHHMTKDIIDFRQNIVLLGDLLRDIRVTTTKVCKTAEATLELMDKVPQQLAFVCSDLQG